MDFATRIKKLRSSSGITQRQLAERLGVTKSVISFYEKGERFPSYDILIKLARLFRVSTDYLLGIEHERILDVSGLSEEDIAVLRMMSERLKKTTS